MTGSRKDTDYVLGTHDEELARLGIQHSVWRPRVLEGWSRAGFGAGQTVLDIGCGPGYASIDLSGIVGPSGRVISIDRSERFLESLRQTAARRGINNIETRQMDLDSPRFPALTADAAFCRWVLGFLTRPRQLLEQLAPLIRPGGRFVCYEYFSYETWTVSPRDPAFDEFVRLVTLAWRESGGEPNIGIDIVRWLPECGFRVVDVQPITAIVSAREYAWQWPSSFIETGARRLIDLGKMSEEQGQAVMASLARHESEPGSLMVTPALLEIVAERVPGTAPYFPEGATPAFE